MREEKLTKEVTFGEDDVIMEERYFSNGELHREVAPAVIKYGFDCKQFVDEGLPRTILELEYHQLGELHNVYGPARAIYCRDTSRMVFAEWFYGGERHREGDLPAVIELDPDTGVLIREEYWYGGRRQRDVPFDAPVLIRRDKMTGIIFEQKFACDFGGLASPEP